MGGGGTDKLNSAPDKGVPNNHRRMAFLKAFSFTDAFTQTQIYSYMTYRFCKNAFTLAEVLITLGIIGVVAAMTLPSLVGKYQKVSTATQLKKFYSIMQQAIKAEEAQNGPLEYWMPACGTEDDCFEKWYLEHLDKHIKSVNKRTNPSSTLRYDVTFSDGSGFVAYVTRDSSMIHFLYCTNFKYCGSEKFDGVKTFLFDICKLNGKYQFVTSLCITHGKSREKLLDECLKGNSDNADVYSQGRRHACTHLIEYDGWQIKDDYPWFQAKQPEK